jgi:hypothetical protein
MKIAVEFDSLEEFEAFRTSGKKTRSGKKGEGDDDTPATGSVPAPLMPPTGGQPQGFNPGGMQGFAAPGAGAGPTGGAFPAVGAQIAPEAAALVQRIVVKLDSAIASGQPADQALMWFRNQCGPDAANYTMDQIKQHGLPKLQQTQLDAIAKMMNA